MPLNFTPNTTADLYRARASAPGIGDTPDEIDLPVQQWPPFFALGSDQINMGAGPVGFLIERGVVKTAVPILTTTGTIADWLVIDPLGLAIPLKVLQGHHRLRGDGSFVTIYFAKADFSYDI